MLGVSAALAGGAAYLIWNYASSSGRKEPETRPGGAGGEKKEEEGVKKNERRKEEEEEETVEVAAPLLAAADKTPEVKFTPLNKPVYKEHGLTFRKKTMIFSLATAEWDYYYSDHIYS